MAVSFDTSASAKVNENGTSVSISVTIGSGSFRAGMVLLGFLQNAGFVTGISVGGAGGTWTLVPGSDSGSGSTPRTLIYSAVGLSSGSQTITVSWTTSSQMGAFVATASNVNQQNPVIHGTSGLATSSNTDSVAVTSATDNLSCAIFFNTDSVNGISGDSQTDLTGSPGGTFSGNFAGTRATTPAGTVTHGSTGGGGGTPNWSHSGADFLDALTLPADEFRQIRPSVVTKIHIGHTDRESSPGGLLTTLSLPEDEYNTKSHPRRLVHRTTF